MINPLIYIFLVVSLVVIFSPIYLQRRKLWRMADEDLKRSMAIHEFARATLDIDVLIRTESLESAYRVGAENGFDIRGLDISFEERAVEIDRVSKIDANREVLSLDLLLVTSQVEDVWETRETIDFLGKNSGSCRATV